MRSLLIIQIIFAVARAEDYECVWEGIIPEGEPDDVDCSAAYLDLSDEGNGLCLVDVSLNVLRSCLQQSNFICEPYRGVAGKDCYLDCARYHYNCCCDDILASPTAKPISPTSSPVVNPTLLPTVSPSKSSNPSNAPISVAPTGSPVSVSPTVTATLSPTAKPTITNAPAACPWESYGNSKCSDMNVSLGDGDCKFNPGNINAVCILTAQARCSQYISVDFQCRRLCRDFHKECCCGVMQPGI